MDKILLLIILFISISCNNNIEDQGCKINCSENELCAIDSGEEICVCKEKFHKENNICVKNIIDSCKNITCKTNSSCLEGECICDDGYEINQNNDCISIVENFTLRLLTSNLTSGNTQSYKEPGINILKALNADIIMIQEFNAEGGVENFVKNTFGEEFYFFRGTPTRNGDIPNGIISRYPIINSGEWNDPRVKDRKIDWSIIDMSQNLTKNIFIVSVHLKAKEGSSQITAANIISEKIYNHRLENPNKFYYIVGGDFNGDASLCRKNKRDTCNGFKTYNREDIFYTELPDPYSQYQHNTTTNRTKSKQLDFILVDHNLKDKQFSTNYCDDDDNCLNYPNGLVFRSNDYSQKELDKYFVPVKRTDSEATQMQHMGVVKDFKF